MGSQVVVIVLPTQALFAHLAKTSKEVDIEQLAAKLAFKAFDVSILRRIRWLNPLQLNPLALTPRLEHVADKPGPIADPDAGRGAVAADKGGEQCHDPRGRRRKIHLDTEHFPISVFDHVQGAKATAVGQRVAHEVQ